MSNYTIGDFAVGHRIKAFHPGTLGVQHWATITKVGRKWLHVEWHVDWPNGGNKGKVLPRDVYERRGVSVDDAIERTLRP